MGGGKKQSQRTKGNVKPSSSSRAAEMLVQDGRTGFIGFGGLSETMGNAFGYVPKIAGGEEEGEQHDIDSELRMLMRKMGKKDTTTKLKAVQEFSQLCSTKEADDVSKILSFWPRIYNKLSEDFDHRVREATQLAHLEIVKKVGRKLAPQLKMMIASWLKSQFDQFAPAASVAMKAFEVAFPGQKKTDALSFCKKDLLMNIQDLLIKQTKDTISDPRSVPEEEREAKYNRLISSTLFALGYLMEMLPKDDMESLADLFHEVFKEKKFWKFARHGSNMIRNAFFSAVSSACKFNATVLGNHAAVVCPTVLSCLDESDPTVVGSLWECVLHIVNTFEDCWDHINARKAVLPKLWSILRKGGHGNAAVIFPNILPFFSKIPASVIGEDLGFAKEFFQSFRVGLSTDKAMGSHSESVAIIDAYMECLRFELFNCQDREEENQETDIIDEDGVPRVSEYLINEELKHFIDATLEDKKYHWRKTFLKDLKEFVRFLEKQAHSKLESNEKPAFETLILDGIHKILEKATLDLLNHDESSCELAMKRRFSNLEDLLKTVVLDVEMPAGKNKKQVLFAEKLPQSSDADYSEETTTKVDGDLMKQPRNETNVIETRCQELSEWTILLMKEISLKSLELLNSKKDIKYLEFLSTIISNVEEKSTFQEIFSHMLNNESEGVGKKNLFMFANKLIESVVQPVMMEDFTSKALFWESIDCQTAVVDLLCRILSFVEKKEQLQLLKKITKVFAKPFMFCLMVEKVLKLLDTDTSQLWFIESDIWSHLINYVTMECSTHSGYEETQKSSQNMFACVELCLFYDKGLLCRDTYTEQLLIIFKNHLVSQESHQNTFTSETILTMVTKFYKNATENMPASAIDLLLAIFHYNFKMQGSDAVCPAEVALEYGIKSMQSSSSGKSEERLRDFLQKVACWIQKSCENISDANKLQDLAICAGKLIQYLNTDASNGAENQHKDDFILQLLSTAKRRDDLAVIAQRTCVPNAVLRGALNISDLSTGNMESEVDIRRILNGANFTVMLLFSLRDESINRDISHNAILDSVKILCACSSESNDYQSSDEESKNITTSVEMLVPGIKKLLGSESFPSEKLLNVALDRAIENGGLDVLSFDKLYSLMSRSIQSELYINDLLGCAMSRDSSDRNSVDALKMILSHLDDLSIIRAMVEQFVDKLGDISGENVQEFDSTLDLCAAALMRWQSMLQNGKEKSHDFADVIQTAMTHLIYWRDNSHDALLFSADLSEAGDSLMALNVNVMRLLSFLVPAGAGYLNGVHWDFILCSLASWIQTCEENVGNLTSDSRAMVFAFWAFNLCRSVSEAFEQSIGDIDFSTSTITPSLKVRAPWFINEEWYSGNLRRISDEIVSEWQEFFTPAIYKGVYMLYKEFLSISTNKEKQTSINRRTIPYLLNSVCSCLIGIPPTVLLDMLLDKETVEELLQQGASQQRTGPEGNLDDDEIERLKDVVILLTEQLKSDSSCLQVVAFALLCKIMVVSPSTLTSMTTESIEGDECDTIRSLPDKLNEVLESTQEKLLAYTQEESYTFGSYITKPPSKELSASFLGYLLSWQITLRLFRGSEADQRAAYANYFRKRNMVGSLLKILFSLLPHDKGHLMSADPILIEGDALSLRELRQCAFNVYLSALECVPAVIRSWCNNNLDKRSASIIERFTTGYSSPILCNREIEQVSSSSKTFTNMAIKTRPAAREVVALYTVEEISMELVVKMSQSHPLGPVVVECGKRVGVSSAQWRQWMLQLTMYLTQQNGTIVDGLSLWKKNVDKKFEGVEECMICFSVVHGTNYQLPTITCRVCKKKYHSACLYKWFSTSNKSTCPLCRNSF